MALFFFAVGLEVKRELTIGELTDRRLAAVPIVAAIAGLAIPAVIFLAINAGTAAAHAWGVVVSTDTAFVLALLALVGPKPGTRLRLFLVTLAVADDIGALTIIALFYTESLSWGWLGTRPARSGPGRGAALAAGPTGRALSGGGRAHLDRRLRVGGARDAGGRGDRADPPGLRAEARGGRSGRGRHPGVPAESECGVRAGGPAPDQRESGRDERAPADAAAPRHRAAGAAAVRAGERRGLALRGLALAAAATSRLTWGVVAGLVVGKLVGAPGPVRLWRPGRPGPSCHRDSPTSSWAVARRSPASGSRSRCSSSTWRSTTRRCRTRRGWGVRGLAGPAGLGAVIFYLGRADAALSGPPVRLLRPVDPERDHLRGRVEHR